ncbi:MAG: heparinase II/III family protein [Acidimicrobiales bacterium]
MTGESTALDGVSSPVEPRPVFCVIDGACRDMATAIRVSSGVFDLAGVAVRLGTDPDWLGRDLPPDEEWRIEWSKFYYGLDLAHAYQGTGDPRFLEAWLGLVKSWIDQVGVDHDSSDVIARRIQNWTYAWNRFAATPDYTGIEAATAERIKGSIRAQLARLRRHLSAERNHRTLELYALFVCALAHPDLDPAGRLVGFAVHELYRNLCADILPDGAHRELSTHYHAIVLRSFLGLKVNAVRFAIELPDDFDRRLLAACDFLAHVMRPDGSLPMLSDSDDGDHRDLLLLAADLYDREDLRYVATGGRRGAAPKRRCRSFPDAGYHVQRSGWGSRDIPYERERHLVFDCGPVGAGGHGHYDALHVEVSAGGSALLIDPGRHTYSEHGRQNLRQWFKGTSAHNTVCVDGLDQTPYRRGKPKGPVAQVRLLDLAEVEGLASVTGEVISPAYDAIHRRTVIFVAEEWWIIDDTLVAHEAHDYDLRFHLAPEAEDRTGLVGPMGARSPGLCLLFAGPDLDAVAVQPGWVARRYGTRQAAPVVSVTRARANRARFITAVVPTADHQPAPTLEWDGGSCLQLDRAGLVDTVCWVDGPMTWERR